MLTSFMNISIRSHHFRRAVTVFVVGSMLGLVAHYVEAQQATPAKPISAQAPNKSEIDRIISQFTSGETELLTEFSRYAYQRDFHIQSLRSGKVVGDYHRISQIALDERGMQVEKVLSLPIPSGNIGLTPEDLENLGGPYQFPLQSANANQYRFAYIGKEQISNWDLYVFDVKPVSTSAQFRLFRGRIWVDVVSLRIVKTLGKFEQKGKQKFPVMEVSRAAIDNRFLFPATGYGDDELVFANGPSVHLRITIGYTDYAKSR